MSETWTVRRMIDWITSDLTKRGVDSARLDADLLVAAALGVKRIALYLDLDRPFVSDELSAVRALVERRRKREPMAYILGEREFYSRAFQVDKSVLIPRPDTELLVDRAVAVLGAREGALLDLCTGSGAVAITVLAELPERTGVASDISQAALSVARANAERHGVGARLTLREGDLFSVLAPDERFACITINPPYIGVHELSELAPDVRDFEPRLALDAGEDPLSFYRRIAREALLHLTDDGVLLVEVGRGQAPLVSELFHAQGFHQVTSHRDLGGIERVVEAHRAGAPVEIGAEKPKP
jgi:release factor glutamine methyltransferase